MSVVVVGLSHRTVGLDLLEQVTVSPDGLAKALDDIGARPHVAEAVVLSTCNRLEVYVVAERFHGAYQDARNFIADHGHVALEDFADHLYVHHDEAAVAHLFTVSAGLDSAVLGETEVLGQVRGAWEAARAEGHAASTLNLLFRHAIEVGKRVRSETGISRNVTSLSQAAVALASERLDGLAGRRILVLGAGDMAGGMSSAVAGAGAAEILVANRTWERATDVADRVGGRAIRLSDLAAALAQVDLLLTGTGASTVMVDDALFEPAIAARAGRPLLVVDIAVPRDVDPGVGRLPGVTLLDMDDLKAFADAGVRERRREIGRVQAILDDQVARYGDASTAREVAPLVAALREQVEAVRSAEVARLAAGLPDDQRDVIDALTRSVVAKVLHEPTVRLKDAAGTPRGNRLVEAVSDLFALDE